MSQTNHNSLPPALSPKTPICTSMIRTYSSQLPTSFLPISLISPQSAAYFILRLSSRSCYHQVFGSASRNPPTFPSPGSLAETRHQDRRLGFRKQSWSRTNGRSNICQHLPNGAAFGKQGQTRKIELLQPGTSEDTRPWQGRPYSLTGPAGKDAVGKDRLREIKSKESDDDDSPVHLSSMLRCRDLVPLHALLMFAARSC